MPDNYAVLGDWLAERDHPRGELIALCLRAERDPATEPEVRAHLERHADALIGSVLDAADILGAITWRRGFIETLEASDADQLTWVLGHRPRGRCASSAFRRRWPKSSTGRWSPRSSRRRCTRWCSALRATPATWVLTSIRARCTTCVCGSEPSCSTVASAMALDAPLLTTLQIETIGITPATVDALATATLPALTRLDLWIEDPERAPTSRCFAISRSSRPTWPTRCAR